MEQFSYRFCCLPLLLYEIFISLTNVFMHQSLSLVFFFISRHFSVDFLKSSCFNVTDFSCLWHCQKYIKTIFPSRKFHPVRLVHVESLFFLNKSATLSTVNYSIFSFQQVSKTTLGNFQCINFSILRPSGKKSLFIKIHKLLPALRKSTENGKRDGSWKTIQEENYVSVLSSPIIYHFNLLGEEFF